MRSRACEENAAEATRPLVIEIKRPTKGLVELIKFLDDFWGRSYIGRRFLARINDR